MLFLSFLYIYVLKKDQIGLIFLNYNKNCPEYSDLGGLKLHKEIITTDSNGEALIPMYRQYMGIWTSTPHAIIEHINNGNGIYIKMFTDNKDKYPGTFGIWIFGVKIE